MSPGAALTPDVEPPPGSVVELSSSRHDADPVVAHRGAHTRRWHDGGWWLETVNTDHGYVWAGLFEGGTSVHLVRWGPRT